MYDIYSFCKGRGVCSNNRSHECNMDNDPCFFEGYCEGKGACRDLPCTIDCQAACKLASAVPMAHTVKGKALVGTSMICQNGYDFRTVGCICEADATGNGDAFPISV